MQLWATSVGLILESGITEVLKGDSRSIDPSSISTLTITAPHECTPTQ